MLNQGHSGNFAAGCALICAMICSLLSSDVAGGFTDVDPPEGFLSLFNGRDLDGWHGCPHTDPRSLAAMDSADRARQLQSWTEEAKQHWTVEHGELVNDGDGPYLTTDQEFGDIELLVEYRTVAQADSGIYLRGTPQVQIWDYTREGGKWNRGADKGSGGLFNNTPGTTGREPIVFADKPFGEWNRLRILQIGARTSVWLNDLQVVDHVIMENFWDRSLPLFAAGRIQLQTHGGEIRWRNVLVRPIPAAEASSILAARNSENFDSLFNGTNLDGWAGDVDSYQVVDGSVVCRQGKGGTLFTQQEFEDFIVRLEFRLPPGGNNGLAIRYPGTGQPHVDGMTELQVLDSENPRYAQLDPRQYHGSAYGMVSAQRGYLRPVGQWNFQEVTIRGSTIRVELNGSVIMDADLSRVTDFKDGTAHPGKELRRGHFGFAGHSDPVEFRNIRMRRLERLDALSAWPQFRGHNALGVVSEPRGVPAEIGPDRNVVWKVEVPSGHSSPVIFGDRIFLTAVRDVQADSGANGDTDDSDTANTATPGTPGAPGSPGAPGKAGAPGAPAGAPAAAGRQLVTMCLSRSTGELLWERVAPHESLEEIHEIGSHAQSSPVTDGERVISFFGSSGLYCHDLDGNELWHRRMGPFNNTFGSGSSPVIADGRVILVQDHDANSFLLAASVTTGETIWQTDRGEFPRSYSTPVIQEIDGRKQIIVAGTLRVVGYDFETGREIWTVRGLSRAVCATPVLGADQTIYLAAWSRGGDPGDRITVAPFDEVLARCDASGNGLLEDSELDKGGDIQQRFDQVDRDKSGSLTREEYEFYRNLFDTARNVVMAIRPGGTGDATVSNVLWESEKFVPFCSSPLAYNGYLFTAKDGGIVTAYNARSGELLQTKRASGTANYYASPVGADARVYLIDQRGKLSVIGAFAEWADIWSADFGEDVYATPAIAENRIYVRTTGHLYCFGQ